MIEVPLTAEEFAARARQIEQQQGIAITGHEGTIERSGVKAAYTYGNGKLAIRIVEKPFFVSTEFCEEQIRSFFAR